MGEEGLWFGDGDGGHGLMWFERADLICLIGRHVTEVDRHQPWVG